MRLLCLLILIFLTPFRNFGQDQVSGRVYDFEQKAMPLAGVRVKNLNTGKVMQTPGSGHFSIVAKKGELLEFSKSGYHIDTLFLINLTAKKIFLPISINDLEEVNILGAKVNPGIYRKDPEAKVFKRFETDDLRGKKNNDRAGGLKLNLGYGKYRRNEEKRSLLEEREYYEDEIDYNFNERIVSELIRLKGGELKAFIYLYKPSALIISEERPFNYTAYIVNAYNSWLKLPPEHRKISPMPKLR